MLKESPDSLNQEPIRQGEPVSPFGKFRHALAEKYFLALGAVGFGLIRVEVFLQDMFPPKKEVEVSFRPTFREMALERRRKYGPITPVWIHNPLDNPLSPNANPIIGLRNRRKN